MRHPFPRKFPTPSYPPPFSFRVLCCFYCRQLDVTYGVRSIGMKYERMLFGMKISDASCLAKAIQATPIMATLVLQVRFLRTTTQ